MMRQEQSVFTIYHPMRMLLNTDRSTSVFTPPTHTQNYTTRTQTQNHTQDYMDLCSSSHFGNIFMFMAEVEAAGVKTFLVSVVRLQAHFALIKAQLEH